MEPKEVVKGIYKYVGLYQNNVYYIDDDKKIQIDASIDLDKPVDILILTHCHFDHIVKAKQIKDKTDCTIAASQEAARHIKFMDEDTLTNDSPEPVERFKVDLILDEGAKIFTKNFKLKVIKTPGHSSGCISLFELNNEILFSGDCWFGGDATGRFDLPSSDQKELFASVRKLQELKPKIICPGHDY